LHLAKDEIVYAQGDPADAVFCVEQGNIKLTVLSCSGKEATLRVVGPQELFGTCCLGSETSRLSTASALTPSRVIRIDRTVMRRALHEQPQFVDCVMASLLRCKTSLENDLCAHIMESSENRLARTLLKLAKVAGEGNEEYVKLPKISHDVLATMVGTTRSRVTYFMNRFRRQGFIEYGKGILVRPALRSALNGNESFLLPSAAEDQYLNVERHRSAA
jgi:CRP-like cAMP-binding protein